MKVKFIFIWLLCFMFSGALQAQIINGNFETGAPGSGNLCTTAPTSWSSSGIQWTNWGNPSFWLDMTDCGWGNGNWIEQTVPTDNGGFYNLSFEVGAWQWTEGGIDLYIDGVYENHYSQPNDGITPLLWGNLSTSFQAKSCSTTIRFVCASTDGILAAVVGLDNVIMNKTGQGSVQLPELIIEGDCAPAKISFSYPGKGTVNWYKDHTLISAGSSFINAKTGGLYTLEIITDCDTFTIDTLLKECCKPEVRARYFCLEKPTEFELYFDPECFAQGCISDIYIDYGDGTNGSSFTHQYNTTGTYTVTFCWYNNCTRETKCTTATIVITKNDCDPCMPLLEVNAACPGEQYSTTIKVLFPQDCIDCMSDVYIDFGDGSGSTMSVSGMTYSESHSYTAAGVYTITVCWYNKCTDKKTCIKRTVIISDDCDPCAPVMYLQSEKCAGTMFEYYVDFPEACEGCIYSYSIDYGDGTNDYGSWNQLFMHTYTTAGTYYITLCWENKCTGEKKCIIRQVIVKDCDKINQNRRKGRSNSVKNEMILYPNPAEDHFSISGIENKDGQATISVYDLNGRLLLKEHPAKNIHSVNIDIKALQPGVYIIRVIDSGSTKEFKLFKD